MTPILLLAAGASARMAPRDKLLERIDGEPLLRRSARIACGTGAPVICTLPLDRADRAAVIADLPLTMVTVPDAARGMSASLQAGIAAVALSSAGVMVLPADMPGFTTQDLAGLLDRFAADPTRILRATTEDGRPGHPAIFPDDLFPALGTIRGDEGGRSVLSAQRDRVTLVALPGNRAILDLDTPQDWAAFRASSRQ